MNSFTNEYLYSLFYRQKVSNILFLIKQPIEVVSRPVLRLMFFFANRRCRVKILSIREMNRTSKNRMSLLFPFIGLLLDTFALSCILYLSHYSCERLLGKSFLILFVCTNMFFFQKWIIGPLSLFLLGKTYSIVTRYSSNNGRTYLQSATIEQSNVISLNIHRPKNFK